MNKELANSAQRVQAFLVESGFSAKFEREARLSLARF